MQWDAFRWDAENPDSEVDSSELQLKLSTVLKAHVKWLSCMSKYNEISHWKWALSVKISNLTENNLTLHLQVIKLKCPQALWLNKHFKSQWKHHKRNWSPACTAVLSSALQRLVSSPNQLSLAHTNTQNTVALHTDSNYQTAFLSVWVLVASMLMHLHMLIAQPNAD